jgi:thermopsin
MVASGALIFAWTGGPLNEKVGTSATAGPVSAALSDGSNAETAASPATGYMTPSGIWDGPAPADPRLTNAIASAKAAAEADGVPAADILLPSAVAPPAPSAVTGNHVVVGYADSPAPMGAAYYGLQNVSGQLKPTILNTTSLEGYMSSRDPLGLQGLYFNAGGQQTYGAQLNAVIANITLFGQGNYQIWSQNVLNYNPLVATNQLTIFNALWNFTSPTAGWATRNSILAGNGSVNIGSDYQINNGAADEAKVTVSYPFSLALYMNLSINRAFSSASGSCVTYGCNVVYFNYSVWGSTGANVKYGSFDTVIFNSQGATNKVYISRSSAQFSANGFTPNNALGLDEDFEMDYGIGYDGGSQMNVQYSNTTVGVYYLNATTGKFQDVPAAYNCGSETGEDGSGVSIGWAMVKGQPMALEYTGASLLQGLWNITGGAPAGMDPVHYAGVTPGNAFVAYALGAGVTNQSKFHVAPTFGWFTPRGQVGANTYVSPGTYTVEVLLSGYDMQTQTITVGAGGVSLSNHLVRDPSAGVYTPEWAFSASDLANLSSNGAGTSASPYLVTTVQSSSISLVFGDVEDYLFPVWLGIYLNSTTAHVDFDPAPAMSITIPEWRLLNGAFSTAVGVPVTNELQLYLYHAQNVTIAHASGIGGWYSTVEVGRKYSALVNDGINDLFDGNYFNVSSEGLEFLDGGSHNYVWGNTFNPWSGGSGYSGIETPSTGLTVSESGDHIFNNAFYTNGTASSSASNSNFWNATGGYQSATNSITVNGYALTGSILGQKIQGGNYWRNYGSVADPYGVPYVARASSPTGSASIGHGADYAPLTPYMGVALASTVPTAAGVGLYSVTFTEAGLGLTNSWTMRIAGVPVNEPLLATTYTTSPSNTTVVSASLTTNTFWVPNGTYTWTAVTSPALSLPVVASGTVTVNGASVAVTVTFGWTVTVKETGLTTGLTWATSFNGVLGATTAGHWLNFTGIVPTAVSALTYSYSVSALANGWTVSLQTASPVTVTNAAKTLNVTFATPSAPTYSIYFTESGINFNPATTSWSVTLTPSGGSPTTLSSSGTTITFTNELAGSYSYTALVTTTPSGGYSSISSTPLTVSGVSVSVGLVFTPTTYTVTFTESGLPGGTAWGLSFGGVFHWAMTPGTGSGTISFQVAAGTYYWQIGYIAGYPSSPSSGGPLVVSGSVGPIAITFT